MTPTMQPVDWTMAALLAVAVVPAVGALATDARRRRLERRLVLRGVAPIASRRDPLTPRGWIAVAGLALALAALGYALR